MNLAPDKSIKMLLDATHRTTLASLDRALEVAMGRQTTREKFERLAHIGCILRRAIADLHSVGLPKIMRPS